MTTSGRGDRDVFRLAPSMDAAVLRTMAERLEFRATLATSRSRRPTSSAFRRRLPAGCWPWDAAPVSKCELRRTVDPAVSIVGIDHSAALIERARRETELAGLSENVEYRTGDAQDLPLSGPSSTWSSCTP